MFPKTGYVSKTGFQLFYENNEGGINETILVPVGTLVSLVNQCDCGCKGYRIYDSRKVLKEGTIIPAHCIMFKTKKGNKPIGEISI